MNAAARDPAAAPAERARSGVVLAWSLGLAVAVFCVVQDRVTAEGARRYVELQREALAGSGRPVTIEEVLGPAVERSVRVAAISGGAVAAAGAVLAYAVRRR